MPRVRKNKIKRRSCALCNKMGHNARTCPDKSVFEEWNTDVLDIQDHEHFEHLSFYEEPAKSKPKVLIDGGVKFLKSPHIVNLRKDKTENRGHLLKVDPYKEKKASIDKVKINFAHLVKQANEKSEPVTKEKDWNLYFKSSAEDLQKIKAVKTHNSRHFLKNFFFTIKTQIRKLFSVFKFPKLDFSLENISVRNWFSNYSWKKLAYQSAAAFLIVAVPLPTLGYYKKIKEANEEIMENGRQALVDLQSSTLSILNSDVDSAQVGLNKTLEYFTNAKNLMETDNKVLLKVLKILPVIGSGVESREHLLDAGHHMALANTYLVKGINESAINSDSTYLTDKIGLISQHLKSALPQYNAARNDLDLVSEDVIPEEYRKEFGEFKILFGAFVNDLNDIIKLVDTLDIILGSNDFKRYLIVFQNNNELRATGGFVGSFAVMDVQKGRIDNIEVPGGGSYDLKGSLDAFVKPPLPLQLVNGRWEFQDSNWFPDFTASAQKMAWFYEHSSGATVDGVIAINATVLEKLLSIVGPIYSAEHGLVLSADNAIDDLQYKVEIDYDKEENKPKQVIGDVLNDLTQKMSELDTIGVIKILSEFHNSLSEKEIQAFFFDNKLQKTVGEFGWSGEISQTYAGQDYLNVVSSNFQGQKSDKEIAQEINHEVYIQQDGSIIDKVIIKKKHEGNFGDLFTGTANISYVRVYTPKGSTLLEAGGFDYPPEEAFHAPEDWYTNDIHLAQFEEDVDTHMKTGTRIVNEFGKTSFGNWMIVKPGEEKEIYFIYKLPFNIYSLNNADDKNFLNKLFSTAKDKFKYSLVAQKQSGIESIFSSKIHIENGWDFVWNSDGAKILPNKDLLFQQKLKQDVVFGAVIKGDLKK